MEEMRTLLIAAHHLGRSHRNWDTKHLIFSDSAVCIGALGKGRSSSFPLLRLCRRWALYRIVLGIRIFLRHVPSKKNAADGPSRGLAITVEEEKVEKRTTKATFRGQG